jgi:hypothetical protein
MARHPGATSDVAFADSPAGRAVECGERMCCRDVKPVDVVEAAIVGFRDNRQSPRLQSGSSDLPLQDGVAHDADTVCVGDGDRALEKSALAQPGRSRHLSVSVEREPRAEDRIVRRLSARMNDGDARAHGTLPDLEPAVAADQRGMAHLNATSDVRDGVERARLTTNDRTQSKLSRARLGRRRRLRKNRRPQNQDNRCH